MALALQAHMRHQEPHHPGGFNVHILDILIVIAILMVVSITLFLLVVFLWLTVIEILKFITEISLIMP